MNIPFLKILIVLLVVSRISYGKNKTIDSLLQSLKNSKIDTCSINTLNLLSHHSYLEGDYDNELKYAKQAFEMAKKNNWKRGKAISLTNIGDAFDNLGNFPESLNSYYDALKIYEDINNKKGVGISYGNIGTIYEVQGEYTKALDYYIKSHQILEELGDKNQIAIILSNIGNVYMAQGNFLKALEHYFKGLKIVEEQGTKRNIIASLVNIGNVYYEKGDENKALEYYLRALSISEEIKETTYTAILLGNIGAVYADLNNNERALDYYFKALNLNIELGRKGGQSSNLSNIGNIYKKQHNYEKALDYYFKSLKIDEELGRKNSIAINLTHIGNAYTLQKKYDLAKQYLNKALILSKEMMSKIDLSIIYSNLSKLDSAMGNYQNAFLNYKMHIVYVDSLNNEEDERKSVQMTMQYEFDKKQTADSLMIAEERKINAIKLQEQKTQRNYLYVGLTLILVFTIFIYNRFRISQKQKEIIELKEKETHLQKHIIEEKHKEIKDSINYAERIQRSLLASDDLLKEALSGKNEPNEEPTIQKNYFVFFKPKDIVSGDFYWASKLSNNNFALITADSTGHGVPGAIMSILNIACLNEAIKEGHCEPADILNETRKKIIEVLKRDGSKDGGKDGMDCSLLVFEPFTSSQKNNRNFTTHVHIAAANNPVWIARKNENNAIEMIEIKPDKMPVGKHDKENLSFSAQKIELKKGDMIYTLTDGFPDQFGGEKGKKYMIKKLKETLLNIAHLSIDEQYKNITHEFSEWKGNNEQVDDVTLLGIKI